MNFRYILTVICFLLLTFSPSVLWADEITVWLMPGEYPSGKDYSEKKIANFKARYPHASIDIGRDKETSLKVLMANQEILRAIEEFREGFLKNRRLNPEEKELIIKVMLIGWHNDPLGRIQKEAQKQGADVIQIGSTWTASLADRGILEDITDVVKPLEQEYINSTIQSCKILGKDGYYAIPWSLDIRTWFYNRELLQKAGIRPESLRRLTDLEKACKEFKVKFKDRDIWFIGIPTSQNDYSTLHTAMTWIWGWGGSIIDHNGSLGITDEKVIEGMSSYVGLALKGCAPLPGKDGKTLRLVDIEKDFLKGKYAMIFIGPWILDAVAETESPEWFVNSGSLSGADASVKNIFSGGSHLALIKNSPRTSMEEKASKELMKFLSFKGNFGVGLSPRIENFEALLEDSRLRTYPLMLVRQKFRASPGIPEWGEVEETMVRHIANVFQRVGTGQVLIDVITDEFTGAQKEIERIMGKNKPSKRLIVVVAIMIIGGSLYYLFWLFYRRRSPHIGVVDAVRKFHTVKDQLHRAKVCEGMVNDSEDVIRVRKTLTEHLETAMKEVRKLKTTSYNPYPEEMFKELQTYEPVITEYLEVVRKECPLPEEYETVLIDFFEKKIRPIIDDMSKVLKERYYVDSKRLKDIIEEFKKNFEFESDYSKIKQSDTMVISLKDLRSCLENLFQNAQKAVRETENPSIKVNISVSEEHLCISIKDNGKGFSPKSRSRGHGLDDVEKALGRWGGELEIAGEGAGRGTVVTIKVKKF